MIKYVLFTAAGVAIGYYVAQTRLEAEYERKLDLATQEAKYHYRDFYKKRSEEAGEEKEFTETAIAAAEALENYAGITIGPDILTQEMTATVERAVERGDLTVEESEGDEWDRDRQEWEAEKATNAEETPTPVEAPPIKVRGLVKDAPKAPAVNYNRISTPPKPVEETKTEKTSDESDELNVEFITKQAFVDDQFGYKQFSFTYFAGDDVLANEEDEPVTGAARESSIGPEGLSKLKTGLSAMDGQSVIYVRNHTGHWEFEVVRSNGTYSNEVAAKSG